MKLPRLVAVLAIAAAIAGGLVGVTGPAAAAPAATCAPIHCTGLDPIATQCNVNAYIVMQETAFGSTANLWWSPTCQSNWVQYYVPESSHLYEIEVRGPGLPGTPEVVETSKVGWAWTDLVYAPTAAGMCVLRIPGIGPDPGGCWTQAS